MGYRMLLAAGMLIALPAAAQVAAPPQGPLASLAFMVGEWEGPAWYDMGPRGRQDVRQHEWIGTAAGGWVITVQGQGTVTLPDGSEKLIFDAYAVIFRDHDGKVAMRAYRGEEYVDPEFELTANGFIWNFTDPRAGKVRYTMTHTPADEWNEVGERLSDGSWVKFFEMTLQRVKR